MQKNTILAFALTFLVLFIWMKFFTTKQEPAPQKVDQGQEETVSAPPVAPAPIPQPPSSAIPGIAEKPEKPQAFAMEKEIIIETPLYRAVFSNLGATLKSFELKSYRTKIEDNAPQVELVHISADDLQFLEARFSGTHVPEGDKLLFTTNTDGPSITLYDDSSPREITFQASIADGLVIEKTFRFYPDRYPIDLEVTVANHTENTVKGSLELLLRNVPPKEKQGYYSFNGIALLYNGSLEELKTKKLKKEVQTFNGSIGWMAYEEDYFISALIPEDDGDASVVGKALPSGALEAKYTLAPKHIGQRGQISNRFTLYFGPRDYAHLKALDKKLEVAINFGFTNVIAKPLHITLRFLYGYVKNYGIAIIILTIMIKAIFWYPSHRSYKSMKEMRKLQPLMAKMREKYKNDKAQMNRELMGLYKTYKVNPVGGCLPMIIQMPVFFALFRILGTAIELRHAPFYLWINDLSAPDRLGNFSFAIPYFEPPTGIPVLTLLMGASMFIQQKLTPTPGDPAQAKMMMFLPIIFTFIFINFQSGLVLYWLTNNILSIAQQYRITRG
jgi:YidC/Oxa1 family membrane protein insertase